MSIPKSHYFEARPATASRPRTVRLRLGELDLELQADRGVFGSRGIDAGTMILLREAPAPPPSGDLLDLGSGYGPIALALARRSPEARVWAVDVNERAIELTRTNAAAVQTPNVSAMPPEQVPDELRFDAIYSNPPVRVGKAPLHELLLAWLPRLMTTLTNLAIASDWYTGSGATTRLTGRLRRGIRLPPCPFPASLRTSTEPSCGSWSQRCPGCRG